MTDASSFLAALEPQGAAPSPAQDDAPAPVEVSTPSAGVAGVAAGWALPQTHLSATQVAMFMRCPEQYRQRYILGVKEAPGAALVVGNGFHFAQETNFRQKIESHEDLPVEKIEEAFHAGWEREVEKYGGVNEIAWDEREKPDTLRAKGARLAAAYRTQVSPVLQPEAVELEFLTAVPGVPVPFKGYIDFVGTRENGVPWDDGYDSTDLVVDYKTSSKTVRELKPDWGIQARLYQMETGRRVEYHVAVKTKDPAIITPTDAPGLALEPTETALAVTAELLARVSKQMEHLYAEFGPDMAWPGAITHPWACGFCGFRQHCKWWAT
jgi:hypothetical protein